MIEAIIEVARGNYSAQIELSSRNDQLDSLAMGMNMMIDDIRENYHELQLTQEATINMMEDLDIHGQKLNALNEQLKQEITEREHAEVQLRASLEEKEMLLKEIHHRVKNNLQVISSLLNLQASYLKDENISEIFRETRNRVKAMALVHEQLYRSRDMARIESADYIRTLIHEVYHSYKAKPGYLTLNVNVDKIPIDVDRAILCGLIINELVTNSLKYAFPDAKNGEIHIGFQLNNDKYALTISDNGIGFPEDLDFQNTESLGLQLVCSLSKQLHGDIELDRSNGTTFRITFNK
jgi:two-component sensor histidine kinase